MHAEDNWPKKGMDEMSDQILLCQQAGILLTMRPVRHNVGTHSELLAKPGGKYAALWAKHLGEE